MKLQPNCPKGEIAEITLSSDFELLLPIGASYQLSSSGTDISITINILSKNKFKILLYIDNSSKIVSSAYPTLFVPVIKTR